MFYSVLRESQLGSPGSPKARQRADARPRQRRRRADRPRNWQRARLVTARQGTETSRRWWEPVADLRLEPGASPVIVSRPQSASAPLVASPPHDDCAMVCRSSADSGTPAADDTGPAAVTVRRKGHPAACVVNGRLRHTSVGAIRRAPPCVVSRVGFYVLQTSSERTWHRDPF